MEVDNKQAGSSTRAAHRHSIRHPNERRRRELPSKHYPYAHTNYHIPAAIAKNNNLTPLTRYVLQSGTTASSNSSDAPRSAAPTATATATPAPCAFLDTLTRSYDPDAAADDDSSEVQVQTTCGAYLDLILIHRELFAARPSAHVGCPAAFSALAGALELRAWRADRDADTEAIAAFRHEAWMVAAWMSSGGPWWRGGEKVGE